MDQWVDRGVEPPPSNYPTLADRGRERDRGDEDDDDDDDDDRKRRDRDHRHSIRHGSHNAVTLVSLEEASEFFPAIPGGSFPTVMNQYELLDFGRRFGTTGGILKVQPLELGPSCRMFVPAPDLIRERFLLQVDADGFIAAAKASDILR